MKAGILLLMSAMLGTTVNAAEKLALAPVSYKQVPLTYAAEGVVEAVKQATVSAQIGGRIVEVNFKAGDFVKAGSGAGENRRTRGARSGGQQRGPGESGKAALDEAKANLEQQKQLFQQKFISQAGLDSAKRRTNRHWRHSMQPRRVAARQATTRRATPR